MKVIPDESTRLAALKNGEVDIAYSIRAELAEELQRTPGLTLRPTVGSAPYYLYFPEQWDPKSPWYDKRVRQAAKYALDYNTINKALTLGYSHITGSLIPENFEFYEKLAPPVYDPEKARQLLAEAGHSGGFDAGFYTCDIAYANLGEAVINNLGDVGIRARLRPLERAAFFKGYADKKYKNIIQGASGAFGNAATRLEEFVVKGGNYAYGSYPEIDELFPLQAVELDRTRRAAILTKMQHLLDDRQRRRREVEGDVGVCRRHRLALFACAVENLPGLPQRFSKKCFHVPVGFTADVGCWVHKPSWTPPPREVAPKPSLYPHSTHATSTREKPANIMANTLTAHFLGTIDA